MTRRAFLGLAAAAAVLATVIGMCSWYSVPEEIAVDYLRATHSGDYGRQWDLSTPRARLDLSREDYIRHWQGFASGLRDSDRPSRYRVLRASELGEGRLEVVVDYDVPDGRVLSAIVRLEEINGQWRVESVHGGPRARDLAELERRR